MNTFIDTIYFEIDTCDHKINRFNREIKELEYDKDKLITWCNNIDKTLTSDLGLTLIAKYKQDINILIDRIKNTEELIRQIQTRKEALEHMIYKDCLSYHKLNNQNLC